MEEPEWLEWPMYWVENDFGFPSESKMFSHGAIVVSSPGNSMINRTLGVLKSFGWSDATV